MKKCCADDSDDPQNLVRTSNSLKLLELLQPIVE